MSLRSEKFIRTLEDMHQFIASQRCNTRWNGNDSRLQQSERSLSAIAQLVQNGKLILHITSNNLELAQILQDWIKHQPSLATGYEIQILSSTSNHLTPILAPPTTLVLQVPSESPLRYELPSSNSLVIGRHPTCSIPIPDPYLLVSGHHAELKPVVNKTNDRPIQWQIADCGSRNGTYVNAQIIQEDQLLQNGDRITLGLPYPTDICPELIFEYFQNGENWHKSRNKLIDCDVLCCITDSIEFLSQQQELLNQFEHSPITKQILVAFPNKNHSIEKVKCYLGEESSTAVELFWMPIEQLVTNKASIDSDSMDPKELSNFCKGLENLIKRKSEDVLIKRLGNQVVDQLHQIEQVFEMWERSLNIDMQRIGAKFEESNLLIAKEDFGRQLKEISSEINLLFKQVKDWLKQSKTDFLDDYLENSISNKIRSFVYQLKPYVVKQNGRKYIQLKLAVVSESSKHNNPSSNKKFSSKYSRLQKRTIKWDRFNPKSISNVPKEKTVDANTALLNFCRSELSNWVDREWEHLWQSFSPISLENLWEKSYRLFHSICPSALNLLSLSTEQSIDYQIVFDEMFAKSVCENRYQEPSPIVYILKKIRSQWMQFIFIFSFFSILGIAGRRQIMQYLTTPMTTAFHYSPWLTGFLFIILLYFVVKGLATLYKEDRDAEREKEAKKIRDGLCSYYQALVKNRLIEKLLHLLFVALEAEERKLQDLLILAKQRLDQGAIDLEGSQRSLKQSMNDYRNLQKDILDSKDKLQKFKRLFLSRN